MIPGNRLSTSTKISRYVDLFDIIVDYSDGELNGADKYKTQSPFWHFTVAGKDIRDTSEDYRYQTWVTEISSQFDKLTVFACKNKETPITLTGTQLSNCSLAFDESMEYFLTYMDEGVTYFDYFDQFPTPIFWDNNVIFWDNQEILWDYGLTVAGARKTIQFGSGIQSPYVVFDDFRTTQSTVNDVLFFYLRNGRLYERRQRDRFLDEYDLGEIPQNTSSLDKVFINSKYRLQFEFR